MTQITPSTPAAEPCIAIGLLRPLMRALLAAGCDHRSIFAAEGLAPADLESSERRVPHSVALRMLDAAVVLSGDPAFGLICAAHADLEDIGLMGHLISTAPSIGAAIARTSRFARLLHDAAEVQGEQRGDRYHWHLTLRDVPMSYAAVEALAGGTISRLRMRIGVDWAPLEMWFLYPAPPHREAYERFFRCAVRFDMPLGGAVFDAKVLSLATASDAAIADLIEHRAQAALDRLTGATRCADRAREVLSAGLPRGEISADAVARALHMSRATLTRRLAAEDTSLTDVLDALRRDLALEYVRDPELSMQELAQRLAFSDARALRRAFQRWTGTTPQALRRKGTPLT